MNARIIKDNDEVVHFPYFYVGGLTDIYKICKNREAVFLKADRTTSSLLCQVSLRENGFFVFGVVMNSKECFKCNQVKTFSDFYAHPKMTDSCVNKCKECNKKDVRENYQNTRQQRAVYERERFKRPERKAAAAEYQRRHKAAYPEKSKARKMVSNAIRDGKLIRHPCRVCGAKAEAHHHDYSLALDVHWLCFQHHRETHGQTIITPF